MSQREAPLGGLSVRFMLFCPPMSRLRGYELEGLIGRGSMGVVFRARPPGGGQVVALKAIRWFGEDRVVERLRSEATAIAGLDHPHILKVIELMVDEDGLAIAMHLADEGSLAGVLGRRGRLSLDEGAAVAARLADALAAVHALGIVHADVKPSNILLDGAGEDVAAPLLSDFGLSRWIAPASPGGAAFGTAEYLDPAIAGGAPPTTASDLYSLGIVCYEVLAGQLPYRGVTPLATLRAADRATAQPLVEAAPGVPVGLAAVVERAMARRPQDRPSSADEVAEALRGHITCRSSSVPDSGRVVRLRDGLAGHGAGAAEPRRIRPRGSSDRWSGGPTPAGRSRKRAVTASLASAAMVLVITTTWVGWCGSGMSHGSHPCRETTAAASKQAGQATGAAVVLADVTGDGCPVPVTWSSGVITVPRTSSRAAARFALGQPGDELLLGGWDCRPGASPALYRPATGQVFYFAAWARWGRDLAPSREDSTTVIDGVPRVVRDGVRGCDRVQVTRPSETLH